MSEENKLEATQEELTEEQLEEVSGGDNNTSQSTGTNQSGGRVVHSDLSVTKLADLSTPKLN